MTSFTTGEGPGLVNAPVAPDVIYVGRLDPQSGISVIDLNGFGQGTGDLATSRFVFNPNLGAGVANDGNLGNTTATASDDLHPVWEVDLGEPAEIGSIVVHNRGDGCCQSRLRDIVVSIHDVRNR